MLKKTVFQSLLAVLLLFTATLPAFADEGPTYVDRKGYAIRGYDTVAYFTDNKAIKGDKQFQYEWNQGIWLFANQQNLERFKADPERFAPQYGGYCAYAVANNSYASVDPKFFAIKNDKLYLNYNQRVQKRWNKKTKQFISQADKYWPQLLEEQK